MNSTGAEAAPEAAPLGRRERNKLRVRERLYTAALTLFTEQGYDETSIDEIAERADVARGTFFNYFQRKEDLLGTWGEKRRDKLRGSLAADALGTGTTRTRLQRCMRALGKMNEEDQKETGAMLMAWVRAGRPLLEEPYLAELFSELVADGVRRGEFREGTRPDQVGNALRDLYLGTLYRWCMNPGRKGALTKELLAVLDLLLYGVFAEPDAGATRA
ncbi:TetR/AcrR family transcriptional regulator [Kitasatospora sp. NPDC048296]|uniref:TetR/AcrR family transcriptional regulator n=1 Tax=Kitasatospora sp. NPDC048296 TaxID=3364048 RepID=UPI00371AA771